MLHRYACEPHRADRRRRPQPVSPENKRNIDMPNNQSNQGGNDGRGFAGMDEDRQREIASEGGRAAHASGNAHEFDSEEARRAGQKGGEAVSEDREHMADIGRKGGENSRGGGNNNEGGSDRSQGARGGSSEQHAKAGSQSHKND
jgi:uncharacterized protein